MYDPETTQFLDRHADAIRMRADLEPLDITLGADMCPAMGRMTLTATVEPPTLTTVERHYRETDAGTAVDVLTTVYSVVDGVVDVRDREEIQDDPVDGVLPKRWTGPADLRPLEDGDRSEAIVDLMGAVDYTFTQGRVDVALVQHS